MSSAMTSASWSFKRPVPIYCKGSLKNKLQSYNVLTTCSLWQTTEFVHGEDDWLYHFRDHLSSRTAWWGSDKCFCFLKTSLDCKLQSELLGVRFGNWLQIQADKIEQWGWIPCSYSLRKLLSISEISAIEEVHRTVRKFIYNSIHVYGIGL